MTAWVPKPDVLARLGDVRVALIEASAGTGKTYTLERLVVDLLLERGLRIDEVLVVTFTEKATFELRARVRRTLEQLLRVGAEGNGQADAAALHERPAGPAWRIDDTARTRLRAALAGFDGAGIATIHGFCQRVLAENAFAGGRLFRQTAVDARETFARAFREALRIELGHDARAAALLRAALDSGLRVDDVETLLFTCSRHVGRIDFGFDEARLRAALDALASLDLGAVVRDLEGVKGMQKASRAAIAARLTRLQKSARAATWDLGTALVALDGCDEGKTLGEAYAHSAKYLEKVAAPSAAADALHAFEEIVTSGSLPGALATHLLPAVAARFRSRKDEAGLLDFDDMLRLVAASLEAIAPAVRARYRAALIDEFQDTDEVQWAVFRALFFDSPEHRLFLVGDPKQAIYGFRGGDVHTYLSAREAVRAAGGVVTSLAANYRSTAAVIDAYNHVLDGGFFTAAGIDYVQKVSCGDRTLAAVDGHGAPVPPVTLLHLDTATRVGDVWEALAPRVARDVRALLAAPSPLRVAGRAIAARDVFVLTSRATEARRVADALAAAGVPFSLFKEEGLFQSAEARALAHLLASLADPRSRSARRKAYLSTIFGVPLEELERTDELPPGHALPAAMARFRALAEAKEYERLCAEVLSTGVRRRALFAGDERGGTNMLHLLEVLLEEAGRRAPTVVELARSFAAFVAGTRLPEGEGEGLQRRESDADAVQIMTMHKSKGLEADVVFLAGGFTAAMRDKYPRWHDGRERVLYLGADRASVDVEAKRERAEEDQRLLYVALTRAKAALYLPLLGVDRETKGAFKPAGSYAALDRRLHEMWASSGAAGLAGFARETVRAQPVEKGADRRAELAAWRPPPALLEEVSPPADVASLRFRRAGFIVTSYSRMKGDGHEDERDRARDAEAVVDGDALPGGTATGLFLHALLEEVDLAPLAGSDRAAWTAREEVRALAVRTALRHGVDRRHAPRALELVHAALATPMHLAGEGQPVTLASVRLLRETEFLYPVRETPHLLKGFIDVLFEHEGRAYVLDWKSDRLPRWDMGALSAHVNDHYALQRCVYGVALARMLRANGEEEFRRRFGGVVFRFLRALEGGPDARAGVVVHRPTHADVLAWEAQLTRHDAFAAREGRA